MLGRRALPFVLKNTGYVPLTSKLIKSTSVVYTSNTAQKFRTFTSTAEQGLSQEQLKNLIQAWEKNKQAKIQNRDNKIQAGIKLTSPSGRLAHVWFDLATQKGDSGLNDVEKDIQKVNQLLKENPDF